VVEEADARLNVVSAVTIKIHGDVNIGFFGFAGDGCGA
jgi:hypothetical protein